MSLLIFAATACPPDPAARGVEALLRTLEKALPNRFVLPITLDPPLQTQPEHGWDWITLPKSAERELQLGLLRTYAAWLKPAVSLFWGEAERPWLEACPRGFGQRLDGSAFTLDELVTHLRLALPATLILGTALTTRALEQALASCSKETHLQLHCPQGLGAEGRKQLTRVMKSHPGPIQLLLPLKHGLLRSRSALKDLAVLRAERAHIQLTIIDELGTPVPAVLNSLWARLGGSR